jgi:hypothetical protein
VPNATGIGPALRKARLLRGKSIEEASRETKIRAEYLRALERERYENLLGEVYVRGFLRSYSSYLGLDSDKVLAIYTRRFGPPKPPPPAAPTIPRSMEVPRRRGRFRLPRLHGRILSWPVLVALAGIAVVFLASAGWFSLSHGAPPPASPGVQPVVPGGTVMVAIQAGEDVAATVTVDGRVVFDRTLRAGEGQEFVGTSAISVRIDPGGRASVTVNGHPLGTQGSSKTTYSHTFRPSDFGSSPSPAERLG